MLLRRMGLSYIGKGVQEGEGSAINSGDFNAVCNQKRQEKE